MDRRGTLRLVQRFFVLAVFTTALYVVGDTGFTTSTLAFRLQSCDPCDSCTPTTTCSPCGGYAQPTDSFCPDGLRRYECHCAPPGSSCIGDVPICEGTAVAVCTGGTWECDNAPDNNCYGAPPDCQNGAFCYGGEWYCANNNGCTGTAPTCPSGAPAACSSGLWYCSNSCIGPAPTCASGAAATCEGGIWSCGL